jgi:hypothetical protein
MLVTVIKGHNVAKFTWSDDFMDCDMVSIGFGDDDLDAIMAGKAHEGADMEGYEVTIK